MSLEDVVEEYSKKRGIPKEEAEKKLRKLLLESVPSTDNPFAEPLGEISKKAQDINQAILSTAYTKRLLSAPPEDVAALRAKIENIEKTVGELRSGLEAKINQLTEILDEKQRKESREELMKELESRMEPLKQNLQALVDKLKAIEEKKGAGTPVEAGKSEGLSEILDKVKKLEEDSKTMLSKFGYRVEPEKLSKEDVMKMIEEAQRQALERLPPDELKKRLEAAGYKVVGGPVTWDDFQKALEEARRRAQEEVVDDKRIEAVTGIIRDSVAKIIDLFKPAVETIFQQPPAPPPAAAPPTPPPEGAVGGSGARLLKEASGSQAS
jgi:chromosome segregation ATPase